MRCHIIHAALVLNRSLVTYVVLVVVPVDVVATTDPPEVIPDTLMLVSDSVRSQ